MSTSQDIPSPLFPFSTEELRGCEIVGHEFESYSQADQRAVSFSWELLDFLENQLSTLKPFRDPTATIAPTAILNETRGAIVIAAGATIADQVVIKGPCYIGVNTQVREFCLVRNSSLETGVIVRPFSEVKDSLVMRDTHLHATYLGNSVVGESCRLAGHTSTANRRLDRNTIACYLGAKRHTTERTRLGAILGHRVQTSVGVSFMPGVIIGTDVTIFPHQVVYRNVAANAVIQDQQDE